MRIRILFYMALLSSLFSEAVAKENRSPKITEIRMMMQDGGMKQEIQYRYTKEQLRIDRVGKIIPSPPINLIALKTKTLRIIHPHNGTWEERSLEQRAKPKKSDGFPEMPNLPPGILASVAVQNSYGDSAKGNGIQSKIVSYSSGRSTGTASSADGIQATIAIGCIAEGGENIAHKYLMP